MSKRYATEPLEDLSGIDSPLSKRSRLGQTPEVSSSSSSLAQHGHHIDGVKASMHSMTIASSDAAIPMANAATNGDNARDDDDDDDAMDQDEGDENDNDDDDDEDQVSLAHTSAPLRQAAPTAGYDDLYLDTIDRSVLDFDFEKQCSISLSNQNVYACLVCGRYYQGRGPRSHAYFHALDEDHHVYINLETQRVYVLPEGYEVRSRALDDIKYVSDPRYTRAQVAGLDRAVATPAARSFTLAGAEYAPGFIGMNNIKDNDYVNVVIQALAHVAPLRNYLLLEDFSATGPTPASELVRRTSALVRKVWNPRAFRAHVSPHELLQEVALRSGKRFTLTVQSDPVDFLTWFLNNLHNGLCGAGTGTAAAATPTGSKANPNSSSSSTNGSNPPPRAGAPARTGGTSMIHRVFQGRLRVESQAITARADAQDRLRFEDAAEVKRETARFMLLTLDLPPRPLFQDELQGTIIPQVALTTILGKYDGVHAQEHLAQRKRYRLAHPLPPYLLLHVKRFSQNKFVAERNPTIVTFDPNGLDVAPYVEPDPAHPGAAPILYDLVANVVHEAVRAKGEAGAAGDSSDERKTWKVQLRDKARGEWVVTQDLFVDKVQGELLYLGESYLQIWERRREPKAGGAKGKARAA